MTPAVFVYRRRRYDFDEQLAGRVGARRLTQLSTLRFLITTDLERVELNEPALIRAWPGLLAYVTAVRLKNAITGSATRVVFYAMENADVPRTLASRTRLPPLAALVITRAVVGYVVSAASRVAFATDQAAANYRTLVPDIDSRATCRVIAALPTPCPTCVQVPKDMTVTFLGSFEERKGLLRLMEAWPIFLTLRPAGRLRLLGKGELEAQVVAWAAATPRVEVIVDPSRQKIHDELNTSKVVVLFSLPDRRWREQVGLPILEGLSHGCEIVTSDQTGIAPWLRTHRHAVLTAGGGPAQLAAALAEAFDSSRSPQEVMEDLPNEDTRIIADKWLFEDVPL